MSFWESLDDIGGDILNSAGGALADRVGSEIRGDYVGDSSRPETQSDMMVEIPQNGPEQAEATATVQDRIKGALSGWLPWAGVGLAVVAFIAIRRSS